ncbi:MAG: acyltransferase family protein [Halioglobus sp.]|nr:acyltransferase family protein [Halioglobus sp.]
MIQKTYRPDIDGLRAVAVLAVLFNHAGFQLVSGGFVGVDIFFVISGYLITKILYSEVTANSFSVMSFYQRRIRRILPAFYLVSIVTLTAGAVLLLPVEFEELVSSFIASSFFFANVFFMEVTRSYFSAEAHEMPFLHMWSLSVEEQFYFVWPLLLLILTKHLPLKALLAVVASLIVISFGVAEIWLPTSPKIAYYSIVSRAGELLLGAILAIFLSSSTTTITPIRAHAASIAGLLLICGSIFFIDETTQFPGLHALWPCLGALLLIWAGVYPNSIGAKLLSIRPMVFVGLISYSLYLWHWPMLAFTRYLRYEISTSMGLIFIVLSIGLAYLSWKYVEQPFRRKNPSRGLTLIKRIFFLISFTVVSTALASHFDLISMQPFDDKGHSNAQRAVIFPSLRDGWCHIDSEDGFNKPFEQRYLNCQYGSVSHKPTALLWGDSHAASYAPFLDYLGKELDFSIIEMSTSACAPSLAPIPGYKWNFQGPICNGFREEIIRGINAEEYDAIFIAARWEGYADVLEDNIKQSIVFAAQHSKGVFVFSQVPRFEVNIGNCYIRGEALPLSNGCNETHDYEVSPEVSQVNKRLKAIVDNIPNAQIIDVSELICVDNSCNPFIDNMPAYFDDNHLNVNGSRALANLYFLSPSGKAVAKHLQNSVLLDH